VLDHAVEPVMVVGPKARPPCAGDAPVVVAVDGGPGDQAVVGVGVEWAARLSRPLVVATVAEPVPPSFRESRPMHRARGPEDPEAYLAQLVAATGEPGTEVDARVVYDPINVRAGVLRLVDRTAGLLVLGTHRRTRPRRALVGSHAARIVHDVEVPAVVVPLDRGG
jgi:nucleotide-binding universal stress UspA family protein